MCCSQNRLLGQRICLMRQLERRRFFLDWLGLDVRRHVVIDADHA